MNRVFEMRHHKTQEYLGTFVVPAGFTFQPTKELHYLSSWELRDSKGRWFGIFHEVAVTELPALNRAARA